MKYVIVNLVDITPAMLNLSTATNLNTLRTNGTGTKGVLKFDATSSLAQQVFLNYKWYAHQEILEKIKSW